MNQFDVLILGAGGAGMMCAIEAGKRGKKVALIDHSKKVGGKILISGGGRCNFTNYGAGYKNYHTQNEHFPKSALSRYTQSNFIELVERYQLKYHERKHGQLFCNDSAQDIIDILVHECNKYGARFILENSILSVEKLEDQFFVKTNKAEFISKSVVLATGGLSIPKIGATGIGYEIATSFGLNLIERAPALDGFVFNTIERENFNGLAGIAINVRMRCRNFDFEENLLFTHVGLSGPIALQNSLHWYSGDLVEIDFLPSIEREKLILWFFDNKRLKGDYKNLLSEHLPGPLPKRLIEKLFLGYLPDVFVENELHPFANLSKIQIEKIADLLKNFSFIPQGTVGYSKAEVTRGGIDTNELSSKTMECKKVPGLYCIGEVVDVTGWLGGYNFQWAWSSGWAAGQVV